MKYVILNKEKRDLWYNSHPKKGKKGYLTLKHPKGIGIGESTYQRTHRMQTNISTSAATAYKV